MKYKYKAHSPYFYTSMGPRLSATAFIAVSVSLCISDMSRISTFGHFCIKSIKPLSLTRLQPFKASSFIDFDPSLLKPSPVIRFRFDNLKYSTFRNSFNFERASNPLSKRNGQRNKARNLNRYYICISCCYQHNT